MLPSLLRVLAHNHDNGVRTLRLFESAATFWQCGGEHDERTTTTLLMDVEHPEQGVRPLRGVVERLAALLAGPAVRVEVQPDDGAPWLEPGAIVRVDDAAIGRLGLVAPEVAAHFGIDEPVAAAELALGSLAEDFPPSIEAHALPSFPAVERDVSALVDEQVPWTRLQHAAEDLNLEHLEAVEFVATYRGKQVGAGRKSVTMRLRFRAPDHTLVSESVDVQMNTFVKALEREVGAEIRR